MKTVKLYLFVAIIGCCFISCNKDNGNGPKDNSLAEKIIGTWQFHELIEDGEVIDLGPCVSQSTYEFTENGILNITFVRPDEFNEEECDVGTTSGEWEYVNGNKFKLITDDGTGIQEIIFSENYTVITFVTDQSDGSTQILSLTKIE